MLSSAAGAEERFDLWVGGGAAPTPAFARRIASRLSPQELAPAIANIWSRYRSEASDDAETFSAFARRVLWCES